MTVGVRELGVDLGARSYPIHIGPGVLAEPTLFSSAVRRGRALVVTNETVAPLWLESLCATLATAGIRHESLVLPDGESHKTLATLASILDALIDGRHDRGTTLIALGGGVVGDLTGFAAACYQRGVDFVQVPTTLLAQVDSSVGGKTAVNHPRGKNMIGAFHQPVAVVIDTRLLATLPPREFAAGLAEVVKYGVIWSEPFLAWLEANAGALCDRDEDALVEAIHRSCQIKAEVVASDERESGLRAILNYGHTFGHAIEALTGYSEWLHGEAVAAGMVMAAAFAARTERLDPVDVDRIRALLLRFELPVWAPRALCETPDRMLDSMRLDKKVQDGAIRLVLPVAIGRVEVTSDYPADALTALLGETDWSGV